MGSTIGGILGDTRSLDYSSYELVFQLPLRDHIGFLL